MFFRRVYHSRGQAKSALGHCVVLQQPVQVNLLIFFNKIGVKKTGLDHKITAKTANFTKWWSKVWTTFCWNFEVCAMQNHPDLVDLVKSFPTNIYLQNLASIQKRTSPVKFAHLAEKSGKGSIPNLSTKVCPALCWRDREFRNRCSAERTRGRESRKQDGPEWSSRLQSTGFTKDRSLDFALW